MPIDKNVVENLALKNITLEKLFIHSQEGKQIPNMVLPDNSSAAATTQHHETIKMSTFDYPNQPGNGKHRYNNNLHFIFCL